jgi:hypothetical protein
LVIGIALSTIPLIVDVVLAAYQAAALSRRAGEALEGEATSFMRNRAQALYGICQAQNEGLLAKLASDLTLARERAADLGQPNLDASRMVEWQAVDQVSGAKQTVRLPALRLGETWLGQIAAKDQRAVLVDDIRDLAGVTCTVFERMNPRGDRLRVCTNVLKTDGVRAIGTFIPAMNDQGAVNPVIAAVLTGETFRGRAFVVDRWYLTAYEPLRDAAGAVVGVLYVGVPMEILKAAREAVLATAVGTHGYAYVLDSEGRYVISQGGRRDGERIWDAQTVEGRYIIRDIVGTARALSGAETELISYEWPNAETGQAELKTVALSYYAPWDWIIGVGINHADLYQTRDDLAAMARRGLWWLWTTVAATVAVCAVVWLIVAGGITRRLRAVMGDLAGTSTGLAGASDEIAGSSQAVAGSASAQAAGIEETSASAGELTAMSRQTETIAGELRVLTAQVEERLVESGRNVEHLRETIGAIQASARETGEVNNTIDNLAFQTNLLALNAAVEAARAGDAGRGFAVVAEEVRGLAQRSAEAASRTKSLLDQSAASIDHGRRASDAVLIAFAGIREDIAATIELYRRLSEAHGQQDVGIRQIAQAIGDIESHTQQAAAAAEESAGSGEELSRQARELQALVADLGRLIDGRASRR